MSFVDRQHPSNRFISLDYLFLYSWYWDDGYVLVTIIKRYKERVEEVCK